MSVPHEGFTAVRNDEKLSQGPEGVPGASNSLHRRGRIKEHC